jgi:hypothetical protein
MAVLTVPSLMLSPIPTEQPSTQVIAVANAVLDKVKSITH